MTMPINIVPKDKKDKPKEKPMGYKAGGKVFKPCPGCPSPAKCKAMGKCMKKGK
jgi:hypothetical protein